VALSGIVAGNTALCSVGQTGNDLHYRGYDILEVAEACEFEEIAHLLIHGKLPTREELAAYKRKLASLRDLPDSLRKVLEQLPAATHPMDVLRTAVSALGCVLPEKEDHNLAGARDITDRLIASLGSALCYWYHFSHGGRRIEVMTEDDSIGGHFSAHVAPEGTEAIVGAGDAYVTDSLRRTRVQCQHFCCARYRGDRFGSIFGYHRRNRRAART